jgi:predicted O-methyltransferase YrrM
MIEVDWRSCDSMSLLPEEEAMEEWVKKHCEMLGRDLLILEIGSFHGKSASLLAQFGQVMTIDLFSNVDDGLGSYQEIGQQHYIPFIQNIVRLGLIERVNAVTTTSKFLDCLPNINFDIVYIDACHRYEEVRDDINRSIRHLGEDGLMMFDDYKRPKLGPEWGTIDPWEGVARAVDELLATEGFEIKEKFEGKVCLRRARGSS